MSLRARLRSSNWWLAFRRGQREGFVNAYRRWRMWRRVLVTPPVITSPEGPTEVCLMCYFFDYLCAIWSLKSFYRAAGVSYPLRIQIQGNAPARVERTLRKHFPNARIVKQDEADAKVLPYLAEHGWHRLLQGRHENHYMQKLTDTVLLGTSERIIYLDSDLLFFHKPTELLEFSGTNLFQQDPENNYLVQRAAGVTIAPRLNVGIMNSFAPVFHWLDATIIWRIFPRTRAGWSKRCWHCMRLKWGQRTCYPLVTLYPLSVTSTPTN